MKIALEINDKVKLLSSSELLPIFERRSFFADEFRKEASERLGGKEGIVKMVEDKYAFDYFYFIPDGETNSWSIPYEAVDFTNIITKQ